MKKNDLIHFLILAAMRLIEVRQANKKMSYNEIATTSAF